jgi:putative DNA primase/helicase
MTFADFFQNAVQDLKMLSDNWADGSCPFHEDNARSFMCDTSKGAWLCSRCDRFGDSDQLAEFLHIDRVDLIRGSDIKPEPVTWLWDGWLASGKMHILAGAPGTGKTTISLALAATITCGGRWPDGSQAAKGNVLIWSGEDDPGDTLVPRLIASGAEMERILFIGDVRDGKENRTFDPGKDMGALRRKLSEIDGGVSLIIVDPIVSAVTGDSHKNTETRRCLQPLVDLAASAQCALLGISHFAKNTSGREPVDRLIGSVAFAAVARVVLVAAKDQPKEGGQRSHGRLLLRAKSNNGPDDGGFRYDLRQSELGDFPGVQASSVLWGDPIKGTAREILAQAELTDDGKGGALEEAKGFLNDLLSDGPLPQKQIKDEANGAGFSWITVRRAKEALGVISNKSGMDGGWTWELHRRCSTNSEDARQKGMSTFGENEHLPPLVEGSRPWIVKGPVHLDPIVGPSREERRKARLKTTGIPSDSSDPSVIKAEDGQ